MVFGLSILELLLVSYGLVVTLVILLSFVLFAGFPRLSEEVSDGEWPFVSIILPVRNQEETVEACVDSLLNSDYPEKELIVVDGGSEDATAAILGGYGDKLRLLEEPPLPKGWVGKNWACQQGYEAAKGSLLLFTDGDTFHHRSLLRKAVGYMMREDTDVLTLVSRLRVESFWEKVIQPLMIFLIGLTFRGSWVNRPDKPWAVGNGQFLLFRRETYEALGGHASVAGRVDEDYRLARLSKERGYGLRMLDGREELSVRMYTSFREIWQGWSKNAFPGLEFSLGRVSRSALGLFLLLVLPFGLMAWGLADLVATGPTTLLYISAFLSGLIWIRLAVAYGMMGGQARYAFLTPVGAMVISVILLDSARRYLRAGGVAWKGRVYGIPGK